MENFILMTDSYKLSHHKQYPKNTTKIYSYLESRGGLYSKTVFFGLQYYLKKYLEGPIVFKHHLEDANEFSKQHFGCNIFNYEGWKYIIEKHDGKLPILIKAVKEGSVVPTRNILMSIENTDPNCAWLTNHCETLLMKLWAPITIATNSYYCKKLINSYLMKTSDDLSGISFKLHDFGYRGVSSEESAGILGMSHLTSFMGTDTLAAIQYANNFYGSTDNLYNMYGYSVPASEHSVACSFGKDREEEYFLNMLDSYPTGIVSIVSDTYDVFNFIKTMSSKHKEKILSREGKIVFRPDSGDPVDVNMQLINTLWEIFGGRVNSKGYKELVPQVGLIQGDGIDFNMIDAILDAAEEKGYSANNWVFGSGGGLLQKFDRDTQKFAIKASYGEITVDGTVIGYDISKSPVTSPTKVSKAGKMKLVRGWDFRTINHKLDTFEEFSDWLEPVFENGRILKEITFDEVKSNVNSFFNNEYYD